MSNEADGYTYRATPEEYSGQGRVLRGICYFLPVMYLRHITTRRKSLLSTWNPMKVKVMLYVSITRMARAGRFVRSMSARLKALRII
jgi:hypothetical protein